MATLPAVRTNYGITALAAAVQGGYLPPLYLVLMNNGSTLYATANIGATSVQTNQAVHLTGDTQLVLSPGLSTQETVTWSAVSGAGPYTYTVPALAQNHPAGDPVCRLPLATDTMTASVVNEVAYDSTNFPNTRLASVAGYSTGNGQWTMQFYFTGIQASTYIMTVGLSDSPTIGQGNLHAQLIVAADHTFVNAATASDLEIDVPFQIS